MRNAECFGGKLFRRSKSSQKFIINKIKKLEFSHYRLNFRNIENLTPFVFGGLNNVTDGAQNKTSRVFGDLGERSL